MFFVCDTQVTWEIYGCRAEDIHSKDTQVNANIKKIKIMHAPDCDCVTDVTAIWVVGIIYHYGILRSSIQFVNPNGP